MSNAAGSADPTKSITGNVAWKTGQDGKGILSEYVASPQDKYLAFMDGKCEDPRNSVLPISQCYTDFATSAGSTAASSQVGKRRLKPGELHTA